MDHTIRAEHQVLLNKIVVVHNYYSTAATLVNHGLLDADVYFEQCAALLVDASETLAKIREAKTTFPGSPELERAAAKAQRYLNEHAAQ